MESSNELWLRKYFSQPYKKPFLFYIIFGSKVERLNISKSKHNVDEMPEDLEIISYCKLSNDEEKNYIEGFYSDYLGKLLKEKSRTLSDDILKCDHITVVRGEFNDSDSLSYLKNTLGVVKALLGTGAVGVLDIQVLQWFEPEEWAKKYFEPKAPLPRNHIWIFESEDNKQIWLHTRGMRKFGRPDISIRNLTKKNYDLGIDLINRFIEVFAFGLLPDEKKEIRIGNMKNPTHAKILGDYANYDFNNYYFEFDKVE